MRKKRIRRVSVRQACLNNAKELLRRSMIAELGQRCELCGKIGHVGLFHILPISRYPRIQLHRQNVLLAGWFCCHYPWHHDPHQKDRIEKEIKRLRGDNYLEDLKRINVMAPKLSMFMIQAYLEAFKNNL